jgi:hypothetical protein
VTDSYGTPLQVGDLLRDESDNDILEVMGPSHVVWVTFVGSRTHVRVGKEVSIENLKKNSTIKKLSKLERVL